MVQPRTFALYGALDLSKDADAAEIKRSYRTDQSSGRETEPPIGKSARRLAWLHHPDKGGDDERPPGS